MPFEYSGEYFIEEEDFVEEEDLFQLIHEHEVPLSMR